MRDGRIDTIHDLTPKGRMELIQELQKWFRGRNETGGASPIPAGSGIIITWNGYVPIAAGNSTVRHVPSDQDGNSVSFTLFGVYARIETAQDSAVNFRLESSPGGNSAFSPTTLTTVGVSAGNYEGTATFSSDVTTGDLVRLVHTAVPVVPCFFEVQILGVKL